MWTGVIVALLIGISAANAAPNAALSERQERCAKLAAHLWGKEYDNGEPITPGFQINYQAQYNSRLDKCFFLEMSDYIDKKDATHLLRLFDLHENKEYGEFVSSKSFGVISCSVQDATCHSEGEWHQLAKPFLDE